MSVASSSSPFSQYARHVTTKLRSRMHAQSFSAVVMDSHRRQLSPSGVVAVQRVDELKSLVDTHRRTFDAKATARARDIFQNLPLLSSDEDPHFATSIRALRYAAYFQIADAASTFALLNHLVQHAHFLDGHNVFSLCVALVELECAQTSEALEILRPRILELLSGSRQGESIDFTAVEASFLLRTLAEYTVLDEATLHAAATIMLRTGAELPLLDVCDLLNTWTRLLRHYQAQPETLDGTRLTTAVQGDAQALLMAMQEAIRSHLQEGRAVLAAARARQAQPLAHALSESSEGTALVRDRLVAEAEVTEALQLHRQLLREVTRLADAAAWAPRRLLVEIARSTMAWSALSASDSAVAPSSSLSLSLPARRPIPPLTRRDLAVFVRLLQHTSFRDERALCQTASRLAVVDVDADAPDTDELLDNEAAVARPRHGSDDRRPARSLRHGPSRMTREALRALTDYTDAVEALAFFAEVHAVNTVTALLTNCVRVLAELDAGTPTTTTTTPTKTALTSSDTAVVAQLTRLLSSLAALPYTSLILETSPADWLTAVVAPAQALVTHTALQRALWSARSAHSAADGPTTVLLARWLASLAAFTAVLLSDAAKSAPIAPLATAALTQTCQTQLVDLLTLLTATEGAHAGSSVARTEALIHVTAAVSALRPVLLRDEEPAHTSVGAQSTGDARLRALLESLTD